MARNGEIVVRANTAQAQQSMTQLSGSYSKNTKSLITMQKGLAAAGAALASLVVIGKKYTDNAKKSADFMSQMGQAGHEGWVQLNAMTQATDNMIKSTDLMRASNILSRHGLQLTTEQMTSMAKAAVQLGRATNQSADAILNQLTQAVTTGRISGLNKFGLALKDTGTLVEKQERVIKALSDRYKDISITAGDAAERVAKLANTRDLKTFIAYSTDGAAKLTTWVDRLKDFKSEAFTFITTGQTSASIQLELQNRQHQSLVKLLKTTEDLEKANDRIYKQYLSSDYPSERVKFSQELIKNTKEQSHLSSLALAGLKMEYDQRKALLTQNLEALGATKLEIFQLIQKDKKLERIRTDYNNTKKSLQAYSDRIVDLTAHLRDSTEELQQQNYVFEKINQYVSSFMDGLVNVLKVGKKHLDLQKKQRDEANNRWKAFQAETKQLQEKLELEQEIATEITRSGGKVSATRQKEIKDLQELLDAYDASSRSIIKNEQYVTAQINANYKNRIDTEKNAIAEREKLNQAYWKNIDKQFLEAQKINKNRIKEKNRAEELLQKQAFARQKEQTEKFKKQVADITGNQAYKSLESGLTGLMNKTTEVMFMTNEELKKAGKTRDQLMQEWLGSFLKSTGTQLIGDGIKTALMGAAKMAASYGAVGGAEVAAGGAEIAAGVAMGGIGANISRGVSSAPETKSQQTAPQYATKNANETKGVTINISNSMLAGDADNLLNMWSNADKYKSARGN